MNPMMGWNPMMHTGWNPMMHMGHQQMGGHMIPNQGHQQMGGQHMRPMMPIHHMNGARPTGRPQPQSKDGVVIHPFGTPEFLKDLHAMMSEWKKEKMANMKDDQDQVEEDETAIFRWGSRWNSGSYGWNNRRPQWWQTPTGRPERMQQRPTGRPTFLKSYHDKIMAWWKNMKEAKQAKADAMDEDETMHHQGPHGMRPHGMGPHRMGPEGHRPTGRPDQLMDGMRPTGRPHGMRIHPMGPHHMGPHHMGPHHMGPQRTDFVKDLHNKASKMEKDRAGDEEDETRARRWGSRWSNWSWKNRQQWWQRPTGRPETMQQRPTGRPSFLKSYHDKLMAWLKKMKEAKQAKADAMNEDVEDEDETEIIGYVSSDKQSYLTQIKFNMIDFD